MQNSTWLWILLAVLFALGIVYFQYFYKEERRKKSSYVLAFLRFLTWLGVFLVLINPKFSKSEYQIEKSNLLLLSDNSSSISDYRTEVENAINRLTTSEQLSSKFELRSYSFGTDLNESDSLSFSEKNTNIAKALATLRNVYTDKNTAVVVLTDGNQTFGEDYVFGSRSNIGHSIYPIAIGDTTRYEDIRIDQVNANRYAFLKNKYPVEIFVSYQGLNTITKMVTISLNGKRVFGQPIKLSNSDNSKIVNALLDAGSVGVKYMQVSVTDIEDERNTENNRKNLTVEVIDEKTNIAIVSDILHPDIGALKKSIESNEQRTVSIIKSSDKALDDVDLFILYQPSASFKSVYEYIRQKNANAFIIVGSDPNMSFVKELQSGFEIDGNYPVQETFATLNTTFSKYDISDFSFEGYPPLDNGSGIIQDNSGEALLLMRIMGVDINSPLLTLNNLNNRKEAVLFGENLWKWRSHAYRTDREFNNFDDFFGKLIVYLSNDDSKERLTIDFESVYEGSILAKIRASYFDAVFDFDTNADLVLQLKNSDTGFSRDIPMLLKNGFYEADLSDRSAGDYQFTVSVKNENRSKSGSFKITDFDIEQQFQSTDHRKLKQLADQSSGQLFYSTEVDALIESLNSDERYVPVQTSEEKVVSLIDFRILLGIIAITLALEWFIRKYNGLI